MPKHIFLLLISTFLLGVCAGVFVFFQNNTVKESELPTEETVYTDGFEVVAFTYGSCERLGCVSYRILDDGTYTYLRMAGEEGNARFEDILSDKQVSELRAALTTTPFEKLLKTTFVGTCPITYDGLGYRYEIRMQEDRYSFDSCREDIDSTSLFTVLNGYFEIFRVIHREQ